MSNYSLSRTANFDSIFSKFIQVGTSFQLPIDDISTIKSPKKGEMIFNTFTGNLDTIDGGEAIKDRFYFFTGEKWYKLLDKTDFPEEKIVQNPEGTTIGITGSDTPIKGQNNVAIGLRSLIEADSSYSTALGSDVLTFSKSPNVGVGSNALQTIDLISTSQGENVAVGNIALSNLISGEKNVAIGFNAGIELSSGNDNVSVGYQHISAGALTYDKNEAVSVGSRTITGEKGVAIGAFSYGKANSIIIGSHSTVEDTGIVVGSQSHADPGSIVIGNSLNSSEINETLLGGLSIGLPQFKDASNQVDVAQSGENYKVLLIDPLTGKLKYSNLSINQL